MSVASATCKVQYAVSGLTTSFNIPFVFLDNTHIVAIIDTGGGELTFALTTDYTLTGAGNPAGGTLTLLSGVSSGLITIKRVVPLTQLTTYIANDAFPAAAHEQRLDLITMALQQLQEQIDRCIKAPPGDSTDYIWQLAAKDARASLAMAFDVSGNLTLV